jgi:hypothetical protein
MAPQDPRLALFLLLSGNRRSAASAEYAAAKRRCPRC